jgi:hypothetical protein
MSDVRFSPANAEAMTGLNIRKVLRASTYDPQMT